MEFKHDNNLDILGSLLLISKKELESCRLERMLDYCGQLIKMGWIVIGLEQVRHLNASGFCKRYEWENYA